MSSAMIRNRRVGQPAEDAVPLWPSKRPKPEAPNQSAKRVLCVQRSTLLKMFAALLVLLFIIFGVIPFAFRTSFIIKNCIVFMNFVNFSLKKPEEYGLKCTRNFVLNSTADIRLGVWHVAPKEQHCSDETLQNDSLNDGRMVFLYTHGMGGTRGSTHRVELYKLLSNQLNAHVIAFDYRGYGDSSNVWPDADGLVNDTIAVYKWLLAQGISIERILIWGHSLGTAVAVRFLSSLPTEIVPKAAVLEAPFTSMRDAIPAFPLSKLYNYLPYFDYCFVDPIVQNPATNFDSASLIHKVRTPLFILHAEDDKIIPFRLGHKLFNIANQVQPTAVVRPKFYYFPANKGHGHKNIVADIELPSIVDRFIKSVK